MKLKQENIDEIRNEFQKMRSKWDLYILLNKINKLNDKKSLTLRFRDLNYYATPSICGNRYTTFNIKKKTGSIRVINSPHNDLMHIQRLLNILLQCVFEPHKAAFGFTLGKSIVDNAKVHVGNRYVYNIDLKDFFTSIDQARIWKCLQLSPFDLTKDIKATYEYISIEELETKYLSNSKMFQTYQFNEKGRFFTETELGTIWHTEDLDRNKQKYALFIDCSLKSKLKNPDKGTIRIVNEIHVESRMDIANMIANLCCTEMEVERNDGADENFKSKRNVLPQGAPTSPILTNIVCKRLDLLLSGVAKRFGLKYSRYADDITFSSMHNVYQEDGEFIKEINRIIDNQGFRLNDKKTRLQKDGYRKEVTGLVVNEKVNVSKRYIKSLRQWLYYWETYGYEKANAIFNKQYKQDKGHVKLKPISMNAVIKGKLEYLKMVKDEKNKTYLSLKSRFDLLDKRYMWLSTFLSNAESFGFDVAAIFENKMSNYTSKSEIILYCIELFKRKDFPSHLKTKLSESIGKEIENIDKEINAKTERLKLKDIELITYKKKLKELNIDEPVTEEIHDPLKTIRFLFDFCTNDKYKWFTHRRERDFDYFSSIDGINGLRKKAHLLNTETMKQVLNFVEFNEQYYGWYIDYEKKTKFAWTNDRIKKWCYENPGKYPSDVKIEDSELNEFGIQTFGNLIDSFKHTIEFRTDDDNRVFDVIFRKLLRRSGVRTDFKITFTEGYQMTSQSLHTYIDVIQFSQGINRIFEWILKHKTKSNQLIIDLKDNPDHYLFEIFHNGSEIKYSVQDSKMRKITGDTEIIQKCFFQNCDWAIESKFVDGDFRVVLLERGKTKLKDEAHVEQIESVGGVKYLIKIYKTVGL